MIFVRNATANTSQDAMRLTAASRLWRRSCGAAMELRRQSGYSVPPDLKERILHEQAQDFVNLSAAIALIGLSAGSTLLIDFEGSPGAWLRTFICSGIILSYLLIIHNGQGWVAARRTGEQAAQYLKTINVLFVFLGIFWGALICLLMTIADDEQRCLLYAVAAGCLATPILFSPASCAFAYWVPFSAGSVLALWLSPVHDPFTVTCLLSFIGLSGFCVVYVNKRLNERSVSALRLEENSEVIKLLLRDFQESASDWLWETNPALELQNISKRLSEVTGKSGIELTGSFPECLLTGTAALAHGAPGDTLSGLIQQRAPFRDFVLPVEVAGERRFWSLTGKAVYNKYGEFAGYHGVGSDITAQRLAQQQIDFLARHDSLTRLPNRLMFTEALEERSATAAASPFALLYIDLDYFKNINERLGHAVGDAVLIAVSERLRGCLQENDFAARIGGDEFAVIRAGADPAVIVSLASQIRDRLGRTLHVDSQTINLSASLGIVLAPRDGRQANQLLVRADLALFRAKAEGKAGHCFYDPAMDEQMQTRRELRSDLRAALAGNEFRLAFQPVISLADHAICGAEALLRWEHPTRGLLQPGEFISLVEESGLIAPIGEWALRQACKIAATWPKPITIAVNLSPLQFRDRGLCDMVAAVLAETGLLPHRLELEITETKLLETDSQTVQALWTMHGMGVRIALDDFGTGYSSLSYLRRFPFDKIKIDRTFINDLDEESDDSAIILAIIGLAERMKMTVTAEGVETQQQMNMLARYGCPQAQGFLFSRPVPASGFAALLTREGEEGVLF